MPTPPSRKLLLTVHVLATVGLFGADLTLLVLGVSGARGLDPQTVYPAAHLVGARLVAPLALIALGTGLVLGAASPLGLQRYWWVGIKLTITVVLTALVYLVLIPKLGAAADVAAGPAPDLPAESARRQLAIIPAVASAPLALNVTLAMYKPHRRWRSSERRPAATAN
ncbi:hypothetical protein [Kribbella caucasensis]|nr:hypothetical protein [Kribbella sp. VKM Ac-2527]